MRRIALVLDATAVRAYAEGSLAVGETIAEVMDGSAEGAAPLRVALPAASLLAAAEAGNMIDVRRLAAHPIVTIVGLDPEDALPAAQLAVRLAVPGDTGAALELAMRVDAPLLTGHAAAIRKSPDSAVHDTPIGIDDGEP